MISRPSPQWRDRARHALFGPEPVAARVILTPFSGILDATTRTNRAGGWWRSIQGENLTMVQVPQGSACIDAILCLEQGVEIVFVGACGLVANGGEVSVGRVVEASIATAFDGTVGERTWQRPLAAPAVSVATVRSLADSSARHDSLGADADCVDMETAWILAAGQVAGCPARALLAVTDTNREGAAFDTNLHTVLGHLHEAAAVAQATW